MTMLSHRKNQRGFTLIELLTVIVIVGVLATIGLVAYRRFITSSKTSEAIYMVGSIRAGRGELPSRDAHLLGVLARLREGYALLTPGKSKSAWDVAAGGRSDRNLWRQLGARWTAP